MGRGKHSNAERDARIAERRREGVPRKDLAIEFGLHVATITTILHAQGTTYKLRRKPNFTPDDVVRLRSRWDANLTCEAIAKEFDLGEETMRRALKRLGFPKRDRGEVAGVALGAAPEGFERECIQKTIPELAAAYARSEGTIRRWLRGLPEPVIRSRRLAYSRKMANYQTARAVPREAKPKNKRRAGPVNWGFNKPIAAAEIPGGIGQRAVDHLKRHFKPAYNAERVHGKAWRGVYVVGNDRLTTDAVVDLARRHGFDPDSWRVTA